MQLDKLWGLVVSAEREPITEIWGRSPQRGPGAESLVRASEGQGDEAPLKLKAFGLSEVQMGTQICQFLLPCKLFKYAF